MHCSVLFRLLLFTLFTCSCVLYFVLTKRAGKPHHAPAVEATSKIELEEQEGMQSKGEMQDDSPNLVTET